MTVRINSFPSWYYPWLKWTFSDLPEDEYDHNVSFCLDMFGYSYYISLLISPLPGILISFIQKCTNGPKGEEEISSRNWVLPEFWPELWPSEIFGDPVKRSGVQFSRMWVRLLDNDYRLFACLYLLIHVLSKQMGTNKSSRTHCSPFNMHFWSNDGQRQSTFKCNHNDNRIFVFKNILLYF